MPEVYIKRIWNLRCVCIILFCHGFSIYFGFGLQNRFFVILHLMMTVWKEAFNIEDLKIE